MNRQSKTLNAVTSFRWLSVVGMIAVSCAFLSAGTVGGQLVAHNTPGFVSTAKVLGSEDPAKTIEVKTAGVELKRLFDLTIS